MPSVLDRLKRLRQEQTALINDLRKELEPLGLTIVPLAGERTKTATPIGNFRCSIEGCTAGPFRSKAAQLSHERSHAMRIKRAAGTKKATGKKQAVSR